MALEVQLEIRGLVVDLEEVTTVSTAFAKSVLLRHFLKLEGDLDVVEVDRRHHFHHQQRPRKVHSCPRCQTMRLLRHSWHIAICKVHINMVRIESSHQATQQIPSTPINLLEVPSRPQVSSMRLLKRWSANGCSNTSEGGNHLGSLSLMLLTVMRRMAFGINVGFGSRLTNELSCGVANSQRQDPP